MQKTINAAIVHSKLRAIRDIKKTNIPRLIRFTYQYPAGRNNNVNITAIRDFLPLACDDIGCSNDDIVEGVEKD